MVQPAPRRSSGPHTPHNGGFGGRHGGHHRPRHPQVRLMALAVGSLLGISAWAFLYLLGAAVWQTLVPGPSGLHGTSQLLLGLYGAAAASVALGTGAFAACRVGGANTVENAALYGLCMWSMSTITLVGVSMLAASEMLGMPAGGLGACLDVGLAAVGMLSGAARAPVATLWAMVATVALSLLFALGGAFRGMSRP